MSTRVCRAAAAAFFILSGSAAAVAAEPDIPAPAGTTVVREVQAGGAQVYACRADATGAYQWILAGPNATLIDANGTSFGTHSAGPTWTAADGSSITADGAHPVLIMRRPQAVPAVLLNVTSSSGSGVLNGVRFVRRWDTEGGLAPATGCDAGHVDARAAVHYSAIYTFYR